MLNRYKIITLVALIFIATSVVNGQAGTTFLIWDGGSGHTWPGWNWSTDVYSGTWGWFKNDCTMISYQCAPRSMEKTDYDNRMDANVVPTHPPYKSSGGSLQLTHRSGSSQWVSWWWILGNSLGSYGYTDVTTNRLEFYANYTNIRQLIVPGNPTIDDYSAHFGTYNCWPGGGVSGENCPTEANNQHYYHWITARNGAWIKHQLNSHPDHQRNVSGQPTNNPTSPQAYYNTMNTFYLDFFNQGSSTPTILLDDFVFRTETQSENEVSISQLWVGYWTGTDKWEMGWADPTSYPLVTTYEIRYSTAPITNANFSSATIIEPDYYEFGTTNRVRRPSTSNIQAWTSFSISNSIESNNNTIYFAIKDVSSTGNGDGHNAPSNYIRTIDYSLRPGTSSTTKIPAPPSGLIVN